MVPSGCFTFSAHTPSSSRLDTLHDLNGRYLSNMFLTLLPLWPHYNKKRLERKGKSGAWVFVLGIIHCAPTLLYEGTTMVLRLPVSVGDCPMFLHEPTPHY